MSELCELLKSQIIVIFNRFIVNFISLLHLHFKVKMPRFHKKKRKGFLGKRPAEIAREMRGEAVRDRRHVESVEHVESSSSADQPQNTPKSKPKLQELENRSAKKLLSSEFVNMESEQGNLTRNKSKQLGLGAIKSKEIARDFKLQDFSLLNKCISEAAICQACKRPSSRLQLWQNNTERSGLAESMFLKCSDCNVETKLFSSRKLPGKGGTFEVNRRSSMVWETSGREQLAKFCGRMNLPPPITRGS